jgi:hypothetical protein
MIMSKQLGYDDRRVSRHFYLSQTYQHKSYVWTVRKNYTLYHFNSSTERP